MSDKQNVRVLIIAENASARFGGEAILPLHYLRRLSARGVPVWLIAHERTKAELVALMPEHVGQMHFVPDTMAHKALFRLGSKLPHRVDIMTAGYASHVLSQVIAKEMARKLVAEHGITVVHQPIPVSPKEPSLLYDLGAPVVMGPMNGGMTYPPGFEPTDGKLSEWAVAAARKAADVANRLMPGKLRAEVLLVANERTRKALPNGSRGEVLEVVENGVDLELFEPSTGSMNREPSFIFMGRLVDWKCVDVLLHALLRSPGVLRIVGDGPMRPELERLAAELGLGERVTFLGWLDQPAAAKVLRRSDALLLPSVYECGGAVVLEAMASGVPVIATKWGGPSDYLRRDDDCGWLIHPVSREELIDGFAFRMRQIAVMSPGDRLAMGRRGREAANRGYDWEKKIDAILDVYRLAMGERDVPKESGWFGRGQAKEERKWSSHG